MIVAPPAMALPQHIEPMLARIGQPFDSAEHLFELKWDGVRAIAYVDQAGLRLHGRRRRDLAARYPELQFLARLPHGTVLDGELVVLRDDGRPDFPAILSRENASPRGVAAAQQKHPVVFVVFDLLYEAGAALLELALRERRARLERLVAAVASPRLMLSEGVVGDGLLLFEAARQRELEGVMAKRLDAPYRPGERGDAWQKIKPVKTVHCLVLGYELDAERGLRSLVIATDFDGELVAVGRVGSGIGEADRRRLLSLLSARHADAPLVAAAGPAQWVTPGVFCVVSYLERVASGNLRAPVFRGLVEEDGR